MKQLYRTAAALLGVFALALQYWLVAEGRTGPDLINATVNFFSFFTILTNILAALALTFSVVASQSVLGRFFTRPSVRTAIAGYIMIVSAVYFLILRHTWNPEGWDLVADQILHYVMPALFVIDWLFIVSKGEVPWRNALISLVYPLVYIAWTLLHGAMTNWYPYPFVDVGELGYEKVLSNIGGFILVFLGVALALVVIDRLLGLFRRRPVSA